MKKTIKKAIGILVLFVSMYLFAYIRYRNSIFILVYHRISIYTSGIKSLYVSPHTFDLQMKYLYLRGYRTISLDELCYLLHNKKKIIKKFCITFDDGYEDLCNAYHILKKYGFNATVYLHVEAVRNGKYSYPNLPNARMISFDKMLEMLDVFNIGSHTMSHPDMSSIELDNIIYEINSSKKFLEKTFHTQVKHFCYPFGKVFKNYHEVLKKNGYESAVTLKPSLIYLDDMIDMYKLPRIEWKEISFMSFRDFLKNLDFYIKIFFGV